MTAEPAETPVTMPVLPMVAIPSEVEVHVPPVVASVSVAVPPVHIVVVPPMAATAGRALTVITDVDIVVPHAPVTEYEITVVPAATAVTKPPVLIVATDVAEDAHVPPPTVLLKADVPPGHNVVAPDKVPADAVLTVILLVAAAVPQPVVTV